jgi:SAM-dependent methyltransferase
MPQTLVPPAPAFEPQSADRYWRRLREPDALVAQDIELARTLRLTRPLLDVGCGNGGFVRACARAGIPAAGIEASSAAAALVRDGRSPTSVASGMALPIAPGSLDAIRLKEVLEHVQQPLRMVEEMRLALRPGGVLIAYVPTQWSQIYPFPANFYDDYTHVRAFSRVGLSRLLEDAGFARINIEGCTPPLRPWQRPIAATLSRTVPFLWRAVARTRPMGGLRA